MALVDRISKLVKKENLKFDLKRCRIGKKTFHWRNKKTRSPKKLKRNWNQNMFPHESICIPVVGTLQECASE
ncbi:hypothetical protein BpHYR1_038401, partial [Brachionus plicatilis]